MDSRQNIVSRDSDQQEVLFLAVTGPTASGKSELAMQLAGRLACPLVCVDAMQVYRGLDVGAAKPTPDEQTRVTHYGLDLVWPWEPFNASRYAEEIEPVIQQAAQAHSPLVLCGGTGLYYRALLEGFFETPPPDPALRSHLQARAKTEGGGALYAELAQRDAATAQSIHPNDQRRVIRALEIIHQTGEPVSRLRQQQRTKPWIKHTRFIGLQRDKDDLSSRIEKRTQWMYGNGLIEETQWLVQKGCHEEWTAMQALGYKECWGYLTGAYTLDEAVQATIRHTIQFAKRQMTWFRNQFNTDWLFLGTNPNWCEIAEECLNLLQKRGYNDA